jgi:hypothetical protein
MNSISHRPLLLLGFLAVTLAATVAAPLGGLAGHAAAPEDGADKQVMVVTTDSSAYCRTLSGTIEAHGALPREVRELKAEGDGLCKQGQVRGGITRLRRALLVLRMGQPAQDPVQGPVQQPATGPLDQR